MIQNNLDPRVAQFPHELVTYGGNGSVFSNWAQYCLTMKYLSSMKPTQTLVLSSGHPVGLFPSHKDAPRVVITNGMVIPNYSSREECVLASSPSSVCARPHPRFFRSVRRYDKMYALGVSQ